MLPRHCVFVTLTTCHFLLRGIRKSRATYPLWTSATRAYAIYAFWPCDLIYRDLCYFYLHSAISRPLSLPIQTFAPFSNVVGLLQLPFYLTRKSCFFLQNQLLLLYCSSVSVKLFQLHCCFYKVFTAPLNILLFQKCFTCITVSMKLILLLGNFYCFKYTQFGIEGFWIQG